MGWNKYLDNGHSWVSWLECYRNQDVSYCPEWKGIIPEGSWWRDCAIDDLGSSSHDFSHTLYLCNITYTVTLQIYVPLNPKKYMQLFDSKSGSGVTSTDLRHWMLKLLSGLLWPCQNLPLHHARLDNFIADLIGMPMCERRGIKLLLINWKSKQNLPDVKRKWYIFYFQEKYSIPWNLAIGPAIMALHTCHLNNCMKEQDIVQDLVRKGT